MNRGKEKSDTNVKTPTEKGNNWLGTWDKNREKGKDRKDKARQEQKKDKIR